MIRLDDLHPDDLAARLNLRAMLVERRTDLGYSQTAIGRHVGLSQGAIAHLETRSNWHIAVLQRYARGLNTRILLYPADLPGGPYDDPTADLFRPTDPDRADQWDQQQLLLNLAAARQAAGLTQRQVGDALGSSESAVGNYERTKTGLMLIAAQRYCRAIGGRLALELAHLDEPAEVAA
ncbi:helix-turn-helix transcriptional regulator [Micromonospora tulbaghiae]|uniref:helix-turn-helix transcriptional regulator n=1 Tax=Micromonospora tulbaghiae TaxID=479978 RepID=UPI003431C4BD